MFRGLRNLILDFREKHEWSEWKNGALYDSGGYGRLIQYRRCRLTNKVRFRKVKLGWINDYKAMLDLKKKLNV